MAIEALAYLCQTFLSPGYLSLLACLVLRALGLKLIRKSLLSCLSTFDL